jgi:hypothetical protein
VKQIIRLGLTSNAVMSLFHGFGYGPRNSRPRGYRTINRLNRSRRWPRAVSYAHAREIARALGKSTRPVT